jgi:threonine synthase
MSYITHLECPQCLQSFPSEKVQTFCQVCQSPILARYDLSTAKQELDRDEISQRSKGMWRWHELLPVNNLSHVCSLGEGDTPLLPSIGSDTIPEYSNIFIKVESINPTASFKARGLSAAVSKASEIGLKRLAIPTAGNAGSALAAYASRAGIQAATVMPSDTPHAIVRECELYGAEVTLVDGLISDCANIVAEMTESGEWFSVSTFREPYRLEGKKTMGFEIAQQNGWQLPDYIIYPTGGGTGLVGMWKAFQELQSLGWLEDEKFPKMISVQSEGCAPVVKAYLAGADHCDFWQDAKTSAWGIRVPISLADSLILDIIRQSGGTALAVSEDDILQAQQELGKAAGIFSSPEGAATLAGLKKLVASGNIQPDESVVLFITACGLKYL